jgi:long-chain acyl-CoA synthetase
MEKVWLKYYPEGVPAEIDLREYHSIADMLARSCAQFAALPAFESMGAVLSYRELDRQSSTFATFLQSELRLRKGDRMAIMLPNLLQYPVVLFGALRAGLTVVNCNPLYTPRELEHQLADAGAKAIVVLENFAHTLEQVVAKTQLEFVITSQVGDLLPRPKALVVNAALKYLKRAVPRWHMPKAIPLRRALKLGRAPTFQPVTLGLDDVALLQYTGGTTGVAKGVVLTHRNLVANIEQVSAWIARDLLPGEETAVIPLPLYHIYALTLSLMFTRIGGCCVLIPNPRDMPSFIDTLKRTKLTAILGVNTLYRALLDAPGFSEIDFSRLKVSCAGGMAVQRIVAERWKKATGMPLVEGYGLSETSPVVISNRLDIDDWTGVIGLPIPSTEVAILDDAGEPVAPGAVGEICVRGPQVMKEYWNRPDETRKVFSGDWFRTGDMGTMDDRGYVRITDRKKDMIIVSGFKVFPNEIEDVVMMHPDVLEVGAFGVPDSRSGEAIKIVVVKRNARVTEQALIEHCRQHLTAYKIPKLVEFRTEPLPKTPIGKILRRQLRAEISPEQKAPAQRAEPAVGSPA